MIRIKNNCAKNWKKKYLKLAKGYRNNNSKLSVFATEQVIQSLYFAYISRKIKKRIFKHLWISRIKTICELKTLKYSNIIGSLRKKNIFINKKLLAYLSFKDIYTFFKIIK